MSDSKLEINVPEEMIKTIVMAEVANSLGGKDKIIRDTVNAILTAKENNYGNSQTVVMKQFKEMVKEEARVIVKELINEKRSEIKAEVQRQLSTKAWGKKASEAVISGMKDAYMSINISFKNRDR